jgi:hypothetical protein
MKLMKSLIISLGITFLLWNFTGAEEQVEAESNDKLSRFLIGNSLTWDTVPSKLDGDVQWHVDCGKSLPWMYENSQKPCVKSSTLWPDALEKKQYDLVSVQVHYRSTLPEDAAVISELLTLQQNAIFVIHTGWAKSESRADEYAKTDAKGTMAHSPAYFQELLKVLRKTHPDREFRLTHAHDVLARVADDIEAGEAPFDAIEDVYRDAIHMNVVTGRYLMHNVMRYAMGQPRSVKGFEKIPANIKSYFDSILDTLPQMSDAAPEKPVAKR